jgi:hypothetical protein
MFRTQKGGMEKLVQDAPPDAAKEIDKGLDAAIDQFRATTTDLGLVNTVRDAVRTLALYRATQGRSGGFMAEGPLDTAVRDIIGAKYEMDGRLRVPKGQLEAVRAAADQVQSGLTAADLRPLPDGTGLRTPAEAADLTLQAARRGVWMANESDDGAVLMMQLRDGAMIPAQRANGGRVELKFNALPTRAAPPPPDGAMDPAELLRIQNGGP